MIVGVELIVDEVSPLAGAIEDARFLPFLMPIVILLSDEKDRQKCEPHRNSAVNEDPDGSSLARKWHHYLEIFVVGQHLSRLW